MLYEHVAQGGCRPPFFILKSEAVAKTTTRSKHITKISSNNLLIILEVNPSYAYGCRDNSRSVVGALSWELKGWSKGPI